MLSEKIAPFITDPDDFPELIKVLREATAQRIASSRLPDEIILARYGVYANGSFTDMMGWSFINARHALTRYTIQENLECEKRQDHPGMMLDLLRQVGIRPSAGAHQHMEDVMQELRDLQRDPLTVGLLGTMHFAMVENTSLVFIPDIGRRAKNLGAKDLRYVEIHGEADVEHADAFIKATVAEAGMGYDYAPLAERASRLAFRIIDSIY